MPSSATVRQIEAFPARPAMVEIVQIHAVYVYRPGAWCCEACDFVGELHQAIRHAVRMQWAHVWRGR